MNSKTKFKIGDIVFVSNNDIEYETKFMIRRSHFNFFGEIVEIEPHNIYGVKFDEGCGNSIIWYYEEKELSKIDDIMDMTLRDFQNKYKVIINASTKREED